MKNELKNILNTYKLTYKWQAQNNFFIISTGRTATNFFAHFFTDNFNNVLSLHEPVPDLFDVAMGKFRKQNFLGTEAMIKIARYNQNKMLKERNLNTYIESNPNLSFLIKEIQGLFPNAKFLFLTRDLPSYLISAYNKSPDNSNQMFFYSDRDHRKRLTPFDLSDEVHCDFWGSYSREEKITWYWQVTNNYIIDNLQGSDFLSVKYEDLFLNDNSEKTLLKIIKFFGLKSITASENEYKSSMMIRKNTNSKKIIFSFDEIEENKKRQILEMAHDVRKRLNYI